MAKNEAKIEITKPMLRDVITRVLTGANHREIIVGVIGVRFMGVAMDFLRRVAIAKRNNRQINRDWYKANLLTADIDSYEFANNAGTNKKTIKNTKGTERREVVVATSLAHYRDSLQIIDDLVESLADDSAIDINLKIKIDKVEVELTLSESLIVVNALAAKRLTMQGGAWGGLGKQAEEPLMEVLCRLFGVAEAHYNREGTGKKQGKNFDRETDFYLFPPNRDEAKCEVKLIGPGNPENVDAVIAHESDVYVADKMSVTNKNQLDSLGVLWVELRDDKRFVQFQNVLEKLRIPYDKSALQNITDDKIRDVVRSVIK